MKTSDMFPSKFLKGDDLNGGTPTARISSVTEEVVGRNNETKYVVHFEGMQKGLVLNRTNCDAIGALYGDDTNDWQGEEVQLYSMPVVFQGKLTNSVRVRAPKRAPKPVVESFNDPVPF